MITPTQDAKFISKADLAERLDVSIATIDRLMQRRTIPVIKVGKLVRFDYAEVMKALTKQPVCP
jgi:excisionase family DNA binding protein